MFSSTTNAESSPDDPALPRLRAILAVIVVSLTLGVSLISICRHRQLGTLSGKTGHEFALGVNLLINQVFGLGADPTVYKPPGVSIFDAVAIRALVGVPPASLATGTPFPPTSDLYGLLFPADEYYERAARAVYLAQAFVLMAAALFLFLWLSMRLQIAFAFVAAVLFGINPYSVVLVGLLHYSVLHWCLTILSCWVLHWSLTKPDPAGPLFLAGLAWGLTTLVRPVTLILPPFVLLIIALRTGRPIGEGLKRWAFFVAGMILAIAPWTVRNYELTGRFIPGSAQVWLQLFNSTSRRFTADPDETRYKELRDMYVEIRSGIAGEPLTHQWEPYDLRNNLVMEDAYKKAVLDKLITRNRRMYLHNCVEFFRSFLVDINGSVVGIFEGLQRPGTRWSRSPAAKIVVDRPAPSASPSPGEPHGYPERPAREFSWFMRVLTVLGAGGLALAMKNRDSFLLVPGVVFLCFAIAYSITWLDFFYYYIKVPFIFVFAAYLLNEAQRWELPFAHGLRVRLGTALATCVAAYCLRLTAPLLWP